MTTVLQQEWDAGILPQSPAMWRQHSRSSSVSVLSGSRHAISGDANTESAISRTANLPTNLTRISVAVPMRMSQQKWARSITEEKSLVMTFLLKGSSGSLNLHVANLLRFDKLEHTFFDLVTYAPDFGTIFALWIDNRPVITAQAWNKWAFVSAPHRD